MHDGSLIMDFETTLPTISNWNKEVPGISNTNAAWC
jgi:hypothetical protein